MNLTEEILRLKQMQSEVETEEKKIQQELEKILFSEDFNYETIEVSSNEYYVYPNVIPAKPFLIRNEKIGMDDWNRIKKSYILFDINEKKSIHVVELASLKYIEKSFILNNIHGTVKSAIVKSVNYTITFCDIDFSFSREIPEELILKNNKEAFKSELFSDTLSPLTLRNSHVENNFSASLKPFLYGNTSLSFKEVIKNDKEIVTINFSSYVFGRIELNKQDSSRQFSFQLKCNATEISFIGKFQVVKYSCRIFLKTLVDNKRVSEFSGDGYCIPCPIECSDEIVEVSHLFS